MAARSAAIAQECQKYQIGESKQMDITEINRQTQVLSQRLSDAQDYL